MDDITNKEVRRARSRGMDMMAITMMLAVGGAATAPVDIADARALAARQHKGRGKKDRTSAKLAKKSRKKNRK